MQQVLTNLVVNAIQASAPGGKVRILVDERTESPPGPGSPAPVTCACLEVVDEGEGIAAKNVDLLFDPFFTTKDVGSGTGLGLSIVHGIVVEHGGWIRVDSRPGEGSRFTVCLPREEPHGARPGRG
jgi:signal transduction histidine kinase